MRVVWDVKKNAANQKKHAVSFEEAGVLLTSGGDHLVIFDEFHSDDEDRFIAIGPIARARWASRRESAIYHQRLEEHGP